MDIATIVAQTVAALVPALPYLKKAGEGMASKLGEASITKASNLFRSIKQRFQTAGDDKASKALDNFADDPDEYSDNFARNLTRYLEAHPDALAEVRIPIPDRTGSAAEVFTLAAELGVNIASFEVVHMAESNRGIAVVLVDAASSDLFRGGLLARGFKPAVTPLG